MISGKTSLAKRLIEEFRKANPTAVVQVLDPKLMIFEGHTTYRMYPPLYDTSKLKLYRFKLDGL